MNLLCFLNLHSWGYTDPTGGDPWLGGPVLIRVCRRCGIEHPDGTPEQT